MEFAVPFNEAKLTGARIEKILGVPGTARNIDRRPRAGAEMGSLMAEETGGTGSGHRSISMTRVEKGLYEVTNARGGTMLLGGGGESTDFTPVELLLAAIAGCSATDVDFITTKRVRAGRRSPSPAEGEKLRDDNGNHMGDLRVRVLGDLPRGRRRRPGPRDAAQGDRDVPRPALHRHAARWCSALPSTAGWPRTRPRLDQVPQVDDPVAEGVLLDEPQADQLVSRGRAGVPPPTADGVQEQRHLVDQAFPERLGREGRAADAEVGGG